MFEIQDKTGWVGVEAETLAAARCACETLANETDGYELPLHVVAPDGFDVEHLDRDPIGRLVWKSSTLAARYERVFYDARDHQRLVTVDRKEA